MSIVVSGLNKRFPIGKGNAAVVASNNISFELEPGESLGLVGESGSGKTTVARMLVGLETPDAGTISIDGRDRALKRRGASGRKERAAEIQMVFQDPYGSLDRRLSVGQCLGQSLKLQQPLRGVELKKPIAELMDSVRMESGLIDSFPHQLSGGQRQRLAIARALASSPKLLVLDEAVSALDVSVQAQILDVLNEIRAERGIALLFVSHDLAVIQEVSDKVLVMYRGDAVEQGSTSAVLEDPQHIYTRLLISSVPGPGWDPDEVMKRRREFMELSMAR